MVMQDATQQGALSAEIQRAGNQHVGVVNGARQRSSPAGKGTVQVVGHGGTTLLTTYSNGGQGQGAHLHAISMTPPHHLSTAPARVRQAETALDNARADSSDLPDGRKKKRNLRSTGDKAGKGLRHFSIKVCEKVESKGTTTYNEVADELVAEFTSAESMGLGPEQQQQYDEKNIRRRVYDALNVLMAMDIITKEKKEIHWKGLPCSGNSRMESLQEERMRMRARMDKKTAHLRELQEQIVGIERLVERNEEACQASGGAHGAGVFLPFILVQTRPQATVEVMISEDMQLVHFDFNSTPFELHDDSYVLRAMGLYDPHDPAAFPPTLTAEPHPAAHQPRPHATVLRPHVMSLGPGILKTRIKHGLPT